VQMATERSEALSHLLSGHRVSGCSVNVRFLKVYMPQ